MAAQNARIQLQVIDLFITSLLLSSVSAEPSTASFIESGSELHRIHRRPSDHFDGHLIPIIHLCARQLGIDLQQTDHLLWRKGLRYRQGLGQFGWTGDRSRKSKMV